MTQNPPLPILDLDHIEFWVGNAKQAAAYYRNLFGFDQVGYRGPETGNKDSASYLLAQGSARLILTTGLGPDSPIARHAQTHGDGVRDLALKVPDARAAFAEAVHRGATPVQEPFEVTDSNGRVVRAAIAAYGETVHSLIQREGEFPGGMPGFEPAPLAGGGAGLVRVDHVVGNVEEGRMNEWVEYYQRVFGLRHFLTFEDKDISTEFSSLRSKVMTSENGKFKTPINEPAPGRRRSQIQEYLDFYHGPGVQHVALLTGDILATIAELRRRGVEFLFVPDSYYDAIPQRVGAISEDLARVRELRILVDRDDQGYLLQLFTRPVEDRPTLFIEIIQRRGSQGFGKGNFQALFESIEREQARRGNL
jgi:4-hydroxyphenylpyruvate dioxygenase